MENEFSGNSDFFLRNINSKLIKDTHYFFLEVIGPRLYSQDDLHLLKQKVSKKFKIPLEIYVWSKPEVVVTPKGLAEYDTVAKEMLKLQGDTFRLEIQKLLDRSQ